jgi:hypothetical protein
MAWQIEQSEMFKSRFRKFQKNRPNEAEAVFDNLDTYFRTLQSVGNPLQVKAGFIHDESDGIKAIDQRGGGKNLTQTRLYIYPEVERQILHIISIGTKTDQKSDVNECRDYIKPLKSGR